ncbi:MAG: MoaD/ThiS family protein [Planctomycetaceae bacterium]
MKISVRLHAGLKERVGKDFLEVEARPGADVAAVRDALAQACPQLAPHLPACRWALRDAFVATDASVPRGAVLDLIPPVSGG